MSEPPAAALQGTMDQGPFTLEILPAPTPNQNPADPCFLITLDFAGPGPGSLGVGIPAPYYDPSPASHPYGYYPQGYYYCPSYSGFGAVPAPQQSDPATPLTSLAPSPPPQPQSLHQTMKGASKATTATPLSPPPQKPKSAPPKPKTQSRLGTPHPKRASAAASSARTRPAAPAVAPPPAAPARHSAITRPPLAERLARLSRPARTPLDEKPLEGGRPLWSGNFAGANSPAQAPVPCRPPKPQGTSTNTGTGSGKSNTTSAQKVSGKTAEKAAEGRGMAVEAAPPPPPPSAPAGLCQSPVIQCVSYNYRPVVLQSPGAAAVGIEAAPAARLPRHRTTSTLEAPPAFSHHLDT